jgi:hypothetical protein
MPIILTWLLRIVTLGSVAFVAWNAKEAVQDIFNPTVTVEGTRALSQKRLITFAGIVAIMLIYFKNK